jgi:hypothetical protein
MIICINQLLEAGGVEDFVFVSLCMGTSTHQPACYLNSYCIAGYALSSVIHRIQSEIYFGNPDGYMEWLGTIDHRYPAYHFGPENPPSFPFM